MDAAREASDLALRVQRLERRKPRRAESTAVQTSSAQGFSPVFLSEKVTLFEETLTADKDWTTAGARAYTNGARYAVVWCGIKDTTDGTGQSTIEARGGGSVLTISEVFEPAADSPQNGFCQSIIPLSGGEFDFRVTIDPDATDLRYRLDLQGYIP